MQCKKNEYCVVLLFLWGKYRTKSTLKMEEAFRLPVWEYSSPMREIVGATGALDMKARTLTSCLHCVVSQMGGRGDCWCSTVLIILALFIWYRTQAFRLVFKFKVDLQPKQNFSETTFTNMLRILSPDWFYSVPSSLQSLLTSTSSPFATLICKHDALSL